MAGCSDLWPITRHAHLYMKGGEQAFAAVTWASPDDSESGRSMQLQGAVCPTSLTLALPNIKNRIVKS